MNKMILISIVALIPTLAFADVKSDVAKVQADTQVCLDNPDNGSTAGTNYCLSTGIDAADQLLNKTYQAVVTSLKQTTGDADSDQASAETLQRLIKAERAWITFRDTNAQLHGTEMLGGSGEGPVILGTLFDMTNQRTLEIDELFNGADLN